MSDPAQSPTSPNNIKGPGIIAAILRWFTRSTNSLHETRHRQTRFLSALLLSLLAILILLFPFLMTIGSFRTSPQAPVLLAVIFLFAFAYALAQLDHYTSAAMLTVSVAGIGAWVLALTNQSTSDPIPHSLPYILISILLGSLLLSVRATALVSALHFVAILLLPVVFPALAQSTALLNLLILVGLSATLITLVAYLRQRDQAEIQEQSLALLQSQAQLQSILDNSTAIIYLKDTRGRYLLVNRRYEAVFQVSRNDVIGKTAEQVFPGTESGYGAALDREVLLNGIPQELEEPIPGAQAERTYISVKFPLHDATGRPYAVCNLSTDITERKNAEIARIETEQIFRRSIEAAGGVPYRLNYTTDTYTFMGEGIAKLTGYANTEITPDLFESLIEETVLLGEAQHLSRAAAFREARTGWLGIWRSDIRIRTRSGEARWLADAAVELKDGPGISTGSIGFLQDITERKQVEEALREQSVRDPLTGLFNRRYLEETLERELNRAERRSHPLGVIMIDIDRFKRFNDTYGHASGDELLRSLSSHMLQHIRGADIACRYGGEEFILILPETSLEVTLQRAEHIREDFNRLQTRDSDRTMISGTLSIGVAVFPDHGTTSAAVLRAADAALYRAKREGRDRVVVAD